MLAFESPLCLRNGNMPEQPNTVSTHIAGEFLMPRKRRLQEKGILPGGPLHRRLLPAQRVECIEMKSVNQRQTRHRLQPARMPKGTNRQILNQFPPAHRIRALRVCHPLVRHPIGHRHLNPPCLGFQRIDQDVYQKTAVRLRKQFTRAVKACRPKTKQLLKGRRTQIGAELVVPQIHHSIPLQHPRPAQTPGYISAMAGKSHPAIPTRSKSLLTPAFQHQRRHRTLNRVTHCPQQFQLTGTHLTIFQYTRRHT